MYNLNISRKYFNMLSGAIFILLFSLIVSCSDDDSMSGNEETPGPNEVWMQNDSYSPSTKTISSGTTVTWTNKDADIHTVTSGIPGNPTGIFTSVDLGINGSFSFTFTNPDTIEYFCLHHAGMRGKIIVQ